MTVENAYRLLYSAVLTVFSILIFAMLIRSVIGPRITDRILSVNMIGTMVISCIAVLSRLLEENYLVDVALIYTMISFVSVLVLALVYIPGLPARRKFGDKPETPAKTGKPSSRSGKKGGR